MLMLIQRTTSSGATDASNTIAMIQSDPMEFAASCIITRASFCIILFLLENEYHLAVGLYILH